VKVLHVLDHSIPLHSGYTFRTRAILEQQRAIGWSTAQLTSGKQGVTASDHECVDGFRFYRTAPPSGLAARLPVARQWRIVDDLARRLEAVVDQERPDLLHAHSPALNGVAALRVGARRGLPVVYECRAFWEDAAADHGTSREGGPRYRLTRRLETHVFRHADAVTCICEGLRGDIVARGIAPDKVTVIPNAVDVDKFTFGAKRDAALAESLGFPDDAVVLGFIGSFYAYEGLDLAVRAIERIAAADRRARLLLVGGGPEEQRLREMVSARGLSPLVHFTGRVPHEQVPRYYGLVDVLVYPRRSMRLTDLVTPLKPLEAMAQGQLVLASDVGGHHELIRDGDNGRLFRAGDAHSLADVALALMADRAAWPALREGGRRFVEQERTWPLSVARYHAVYASAMRRARTGADAQAVSR
jgi:PEP-CTERM/exosortase A-associated glycosyltransferase